MWEQFWQSFVTWLRTHWPYFAGGLVAVGLLLYAVISNAREERRRIRELERELGPRLAKYDAMFEKKRKHGEPSGSP